MRLPSLVLPAETWSSPRAQALALEQREHQYRRTDQLFVRLLACEFVAGIAAAAWISPYAWAGHEWEVHPHVWSATLLGGLIVSLPIALAWVLPGKSLTRQVIGIAQLLMSGLLIHLTQGRIETHFHVFGSLAFLAFYRDWRVLITASAVTALDHLVRGYAWPVSIYGVELYSPWRWLEHAAWVIFEDIFLVLACLQSNRETNAIAERQCELENTHHELDIRVKERTADLECANEALQAEVSERVRAEAALRLSEFSVANASLPTFWIASDAHILRVNRAVSELLGYSESELLTLSITDLYVDFDRERWSLHWQELREKKRMCFETQQRHKRGHIIPIEVDLNWFEFEGLEYKFGYVRDMREIKRDKELLAQRAAELETQRLDALDLARAAEDARLRAQRSEDRLNLALKSSGVGTWSWNIVENSVFWDEYLHPLFGLKPGTFGGTFEAFATLVAPEERERVQREVTLAIEQNTEYDTEYRVVWPDASFHVLAARGKVYRDAAGQALSMTGVCWDVTERHLVERSLHESQERFALAVEGSRDGIWDWNVSTNQVFYSSRWKSMLGYEDHEIENQFSAWERLVHPEDLTHAQQILKEYFAGQRPEYTVEFRMLHKSGDWRWILARGVAQRDATGGVIRLSGSHTDISERKRAEEELHRAKEVAESANRVLDSSLKSIADGVIVADATGKFLFWNVVAEEIIGLGATDTPIEGWTSRYGCFLTDMVTPYPPEDLPLVRTIRGESVHDVDLFIRNPKKPEGVWISVNGRPLMDHAGELRGGVVVFRDMTERRQAQETLARQARELARSNTELQQFAYIASHDLQEPLRKVQSFGDMLAKDAGPALSVDGLDYLKRMQNAAARMQQLINDLLSYSRVASQAQPFVTVDLARVASEVLTDLESRIASTGGQVQLGELPSLDADPLQMRQLLQNLIGNALKFHRPNVPPVVSVQSRRVTPKTGLLAGLSAWEITVQDNGIGFDEKYLDRIFAPFQRLHGRGEYEGTGIGLAICYKIAHRHGGTITARSVPGEGSRFIVTLPLVQETRDQSHAPGDTHHAQTR